MTRLVKTVEEQQEAMRLSYLAGVVDTHSEDGMKVGADLAHFLRTITTYLENVYE